MTERPLNPGRVSAALVNRPPPNGGRGGRPLEYLKTLLSKRSAPYKHLLSSAPLLTLSPAPSKSALLGLHGNITMETLAVRQVGGKRFLLHITVLIESSTGPVCLYVMSMLAARWRQQGGVNHQSTRSSRLNNQH